MCDYSLHSVSSRDAEINDILVTTVFPHTITRGFRAAGDHEDCAVCLKPGTELEFTDCVKVQGFIFNRRIKSKLARFRKVDLGETMTHHDALELDNGKIVKLTNLVPGQIARVIQMPASEAKVRKSLPAQTLLFNY